MIDKPYIGEFNAFKGYTYAQREQSAEKWAWMMTNYFKELIEILEKKYPDRVICDNCSIDYVFDLEIKAFKGSNT